MSIAKDVIADSGIAFGTSGARGLVEQFTGDVCAAFTIAFLAKMKLAFDSKRVAIAIDRRPSSPEMASYCLGAAHAMGFEVEYYGVIPTPALALQAMTDQIPCIMITGSHIPFDRNGIKFYRPDGEITKGDEQDILTSNHRLPDFQPINLKASLRAKANYISRYISLCAKDHLKGLRIGVYEHSAAGRDITIDILEILGAKVVSLGRSDDFVPIDTEAVSAEDREKGREWSFSHGLDAIVSTDGDGDRPLVADEHGEWLRGDILGLLCAKSLGIEVLAVPVSCNSAIEQTGVFKDVLRTRIGSPYVIEGMNALSEKHNSVAGFEANGGFLLNSNISINGTSLKSLPTRDAILPMVTLLADSRSKDVRISELTRQLPERYTASDRIKEFPTEKSKRLIQEWGFDLSALVKDLRINGQVHSANKTDGLRVTFGDGDIVHLRPSGNAPELRCYVESTSERGAANLLSHCMNQLNKFA